MTVSIDLSERAARCRQQPHAVPIAIRAGRFSTGLLGRRGNAAHSTFDTISESIEPWLGYYK